MATRTNQDKATANNNSASQPNFVVVILVLTLIGVVCGAGFGIFVLKSKPLAVATTAVKLPEKEPVSQLPLTSRYPAEAVEVALDPIISSIGPNDKTKMRLEVSMIVNKSGASSPLLKKEMTEDIIAFLRSISMEDISGSRGFQNLREDLDDLAQVRGRGAVYGLLISGFVVE